MKCLIGQQKASKNYVECQTMEHLKKTCKKKKEIVYITGNEDSKK
jgi:hypothetical protein